jgi:hypothetical protein
METPSQGREERRHILATIDRRIASIPPAPAQHQAFKYRCRPNAWRRKEEPIMQMQQEPVAFNVRRVVVEMLFLAAQMLVLGIGVAVAISVPVFIWALSTTP